MFSLEINPSISEAKTAYSCVEGWAKFQRAPFSFNFFAMSPTIRKEPKGVVLIISPFNYPIWLSFVPFVCLHFTPHL
jgi:aldehyde dehydrogenase (NAD+)